MRRCSVQEAILRSHRKRRSRSRCTSILTSSGMPLDSAYSTFAFNPSSRLPVSTSDCSTNFGCTSVTLKSALASPKQASASTAAAQRRRLILAESRIIKSIHAGLARQNLSSHGPRPPRAHGQDILGGVGMTPPEGRHLIFVFDRKDRAGCVQKLTSGFEQGPQAVENAFLRGDQPRQILGPAADLDVRMAANHAGGGTGRVGEYPVERTSVPPRRWIRGIAHDALR